MTLGAPAVRARSPMTDVVASVLLGILPGLLLAAMLSDVALGWRTTPRLPVDFHTFWRAGHYYVHGHSPYRSSFAHTFVYPAPVAALFTPFALLPYHIAGAIYLAICTAAVVASLWMAGVRDWRCYGATFLSPAVLTAITLGTLTPLLLLALVATWRLRTRRVVAVPVAFLMVGKLIFWPVLVWLVLTGRRRAAVEAAALGIAMAVIGWAPIGFAGLIQYPGLLLRLGAGFGAKSYAVTSLVGGGRAADAAISVAAVAGLWAARTSEERSLFSLALLATFACSPIVWLHYFALLIAVAAVSVPRFSILWLIPVLLWATPQQMAGSQEWRVVVGIAVCALVVILARPTVRFARGDPRAFVCD